jgi:hypothetical protein
MKKYLVLLLCFYFYSGELFSQSLGIYSPATVFTGGNTNVFPASSPSNTVKITVTTSSTFTGVLAARATSGMITITNAKPAGVYTVVVRAFNASGSSTTKSFTLTVKKPECSLGSFSGNVELQVRPNLNSTAVGDFNLDGKQDLVAAHEGFNTLSIRLGNGQGGFGNSVEIPAGSHPYSVVVGDIDRDGVHDILNTNQGSDMVTVFTGVGGTSFAIEPSVSVGTGPVSIALGDFNNDGKPDFATANHNSATVSIKNGDGAGGFSGNLQVSVLPYPSCVAVGDFNNDGNQDLAITSSTLNKICIRLGNGNSNFSGNTEISVGTNPNYVAIGDFNMDGIQDLATANYLSNTISIRIGDGLGNFFGNTEVSVGDGPQCVAVGNFNGDNFPDVVSANYFSNTVSVRYGNGTGIFNGTAEYNVGSYPLHISVGDFNNDKRNDLAVSNYQDHTISIRDGVEDQFSFVYTINNSPVCNGQDILLFTISGGFYSWSGPGGFSSTNQNPVIPQAALNHSGVYTVTVTSPSNCTMSSSTNVSVVSLPSVTFTLPDDTIYINEPPMALGGASPLNGVFSGPGVTSDGFFNPAVTGPGTFILTYTYTDINGCSNYDNERIYVLLNTEVPDRIVKGSIRVFPNPVKEDIKIDLTAIPGNVKFSLIDCEGKTVKEWESEGTKIATVSVPDLSSGVYFLKLISGDTVNYSKVILDK